MAQPLISTKYTLPYTPRRKAQGYSAEHQRNNWLNVAVAVMIVITGLASWYIFGLNKAKETSQRLQLQGVKQEKSLPVIHQPVNQTAQ